MAKAKGTKKEAKNTQSHIRARLDYLYQAAVYLQGKSTEHKKHSTAPAVHGNRNNQSAENQTSPDGAGSQSEADIKQKTCSVSQQTANKPLENLSRTCVLHLRDVAMKTQIRLPVDLKRSLCKRCATVLTPEVTCSREIRNESRGGKKPGANVLIVRCLSCGAEKRFPQTDKRAKKLVQRRNEAIASLQNGPDVEASLATSKGGHVHDGNDSTIPTSSKT